MICNNDIVCNGHGNPVLRHGVFVFTFSISYHHGRIKVKYKQKDIFMQLSIQLPDDVAEAFINEVPEQERNNIITQLFSEYVDKRERLMEEL